VKHVGENRLLFGEDVDKNHGLGYFLGLPCSSVIKKRRT